MRTGKTFAAGHGIYRDDEHGRRELAGGITFVDRAASGKEFQDGTAERPYSAIGRAVAKAGENRTIFVQEGEYEEHVVLRPGQILTSEIRVDDEVVYVAPFLPLIRPKQFQPLDENEEVRKGWEKEAAAVLLRGGGTLCRLRVETCRDKALAVLVAPDASDEGGLVRVERCELRTEGRFAHALLCRFKGELRFGRVEPAGNTAITRGDAAVGIWARLDDAAQLGGLHVSDNTLGTRGDYAGGIEVWLDDAAHLDDLNVSGNTIRVEGAHANGIEAWLNAAAQLDSLTVSGNAILAAGGLAEAIVLKGGGLPDAAALTVRNAVWTEETRE